MRTSRQSIVLAVLVFVVGLALVGSWSRRRGPGRCALDGQEIDPRYRVRIVDDRGPGSAFCCLRCAQMWLAARGGGPYTILVTDEVSGQEIAAGQAWFVRSAVVTQPATGNRIHAFRERQDAEKHAEAARGRLLEGEDRPFADP